jgi:hypothetical protein
VNVTLDIRIGGNTRWELTLQSRSTEAHVLMTEHKDALRFVLGEASREIHEILQQPITVVEQPHAELD